MKTKILPKADERARNELFGRYFRKNNVVLQSQLFIDLAHLLCEDSVAYVATSLLNLDLDETEPYLTQALAGHGLRMTTGKTITADLGFNSSFFAQRQERNPFARYLQSLGLASEVEDDSRFYQIAFHPEGTEQLLVLSSPFFQVRPALFCVEQVGQHRCDVPPSSRPAFLW